MEGLLIIGLLIVWAVVPFIAMRGAYKIAHDYHVGIVDIHVRYMDAMLSSIKECIDTGYPEIAGESIERTRKYISEWPAEERKRGL
jgi:hypothetical protein